MPDEQAIGVSALQRLATLCRFQADVARVRVEHAQHGCAFLQVRAKEGKWVVQAPLQQRSGARIGYYTWFFLHGCVDYNHNLKPSMSHILIQYAQGFEAH
jgi:hypothetical protein